MVGLVLLFGSGEWPKPPYDQCAPGCDSVGGGAVNRGWAFCCGFLGRRFTARRPPLTGA